MLVPLTTAVIGFQQTSEQLPPTSLTVRTAVRVVLFGFIALLLGYILIEQVGYWWRRRSGRGE
ncbi:MAG: hypothetical protein ACM3O7_07880 [Acidobacteriota bacterium]